MRICLHKPLKKTNYFFSQIKIDQQVLDNQIRPLNVFLHHLIDQLEQIDDYHYFANPVDETEVK
jgi:hypothetical protein